MWPNGGVRWIQKIVLCHGCFDILHIGHFTHLRAARALGDYLIVSITAAPFVEKFKGAGHPAHSDEERLQQLRDLRMVDMAYLCNAATGAEAIRRWRPHIYCKGTDYAARSLHQDELAACKEVGAEVRFTDTAKRSVAEMVGKFRGRRA